MASIHALPVELLTRIFSLGTHDPILDFSSPAAPIPRDPPFEVLVSHVCSHWRHVALCQPALWTDIALTQVSHIPRALAYVSRSARLPFDILFDSTSESDYVRGHHIFRDEFLPAFDPLKPHIDRWRSLVLRVRDLPCKRHARTVLSTVGPGPQLRTLDLYHIEDWQDADRLWGHVGPPPVVVFDGALPLLRRLSLIGVNIQWSAAASPFLRNLTELELGVHSDDVRIPFDRWLDVLRESPGLERLALHYSGPRIAGTPWDLPEGPVSLLELRDLKLADLDATYACALLRTFVAPYVRKLHLELGSMSETQDYTPFVNMLVDAPDPAACPAVLDPSAIYVPPQVRAHASSPPPDEDRGGKGKSKAKTNGIRAPRPMFPHLEELSIAALATCTLASWHALLRGATKVRTLAVDFGQMDRGAFDVLAGALRGPSFPIVTHHANGAYHHSGDPYVVIAEAASFSGTPPPRPEMDPRLLPALKTLKVAGVEGAELARYWRARKRMGLPVRRLLVSVKDRDRETEKLKAEVEAGAKAGDGDGDEPCTMEWFHDEEDDAEDDQEGVDDGLEETEGELEDDDADADADVDADGVEDEDEGAYIPASGSDDTGSEDHQHHHHHQPHTAVSAS